jgi:hypothetical protein
MAIEYFIYSDIDKAELDRRLSIAANAANGLWESWSAKDDLGPFHEEIMEEYGVDKGFQGKSVLQAFQRASRTRRARPRWHSSNPCRGESCF